MWPNDLQRKRYDHLIVTSRSAAHLQDSPGGARAPTRVFWQSFRLAPLRMNVNLWRSHGLRARPLLQ